MADGEKVAGIDRKWWYVIGAGAGIIGYFVYHWYKTNQQAAALASGLGAMPSGAGTATTDLSGTTGSTVSAPTISTLYDWMAQAQTWLVKNLNADPAIVQSALQHYANGHCLTSQEYDYIDRALGQLGMPPGAPYQGLVKCPNAPAPPVKPPPTTGLAVLVKITTAQIAKLLASGYDILWVHGIPYYYPKQTGGLLPGRQLTYISTNMEVAALKQHGYTIVNYAGMLFYNPKQRVAHPITIPT